ncbi:MAG TPA: SGNH/GDSL hydrolase family protein [Chloroflexota bacterium]|nr:SGNH/GDSL hydrolase family protein [Chloroflexota bacterium]
MDWLGQHGTLGAAGPGTPRGARRRAVLAAGGIAAGTLGLGITACRLLGRQTARLEQGEEVPSVLTIYTFGDSILDCGRYNAHGITPGALLVRNDDRLFPELRGQDLATLVPRLPVRLEHRARDGATVDDLPAQARGIPGPRRREPAGAPAGAGSDGDERGIALLTVGGNDLLRGLILDTGPGIEAFAEALDAAVAHLTGELGIRPVLIGNVYDPTFGDDARNFLGVDPRVARTNHRRMNAALAQVAGRYGELVDLHRHFLAGDPSWYTATIEPSLRGASEVRRAFWPRVAAVASALAAPA